MITAFQNLVYPNPLMNIFVLCTGRIPSIDRKKIGLIGHTKGGYETNFIATKFDRLQPNFQKFTYK